MHYKDDSRQAGPAAPSGDDPTAANEESHQQRIDRLFREHNQVLLQFLAARLHSEHEAKEVAQEAYVRLLNLDKPGAVSYLRAYLFKTAANLANDRRKHYSRRERIHELIFFETRDDASPSPEGKVAAREELEIIRRAIEEIPAKCRMAFLLHKFRGLSFRETAAQMQLSERMVRVYVARAIYHCRQSLQAANRRAPAGTSEGRT